MIIILAWLFILDFVPGETLEIKYNFCKKTPMVTELSPGNRLWPIEKLDDECWQKIAASPVYFDTRAPQYFERAVVEVKYKNPDSEKFQLGPQTKKDEWLWLLKNIEPQNQNNNWTIGKAEFDLQGVFQNFSHMRWLISAPDAEENKNVIWVSEIQITFYKDALGFDNFIEQVKSYLRKIVR